MQNAISFYLQRTKFVQRIHEWQRVDVDLDLRKQPDMGMDSGHPRVKKATY